MSVRGEGVGGESKRKGLEGRVRGCVCVHERRRSTFRIALRGAVFLVSAVGIADRTARDNTEGAVGVGGGGVGGGGGGWSYIVCIQPTNGGNQKRCYICNQRADSTARDNTGEGGGGGGGSNCAYNQPMVEMKQYYI